MTHAQIVMLIIVVALIIIWVLAVQLNSKAISLKWVNDRVVDNERKWDDLRRQMFSLILQNSQSVVDSSITLVFVDDCIKVYKDGEEVDFFSDTPDGLSEFYIFLNQKTKVKK